VRIPTSFQNRSPNIKTAHNGSRRSVKAGERGIRVVRCGCEQDSGGIHCGNECVKTNTYIPAVRGSDNVADEGLQKNATTLSQIPTYVTGVPNGTEKVCRSRGIKCPETNKSRDSIWPSTWEERISESAQFNYTEIPHSALRNRR